MANIIRKSWRDSSSLMILTRKCRQVFTERDAFDYDILVQTRNKDASSFPNSVVFPGGLTEVVDASGEWVQLIKSFGYSQQQFDALHDKQATLSPIFQDDPVNKHISLRITAIRETFEELGLLIGSRKHKNSTHLWAEAITDFDIKLWQKKVSDNPEELFNLCRELNCYPDIWSLHYWSNWLTPIHFKKRFETAFFISAFKDRPAIIGNKEVADVQWTTPSGILDKQQQGEVVAYPPQLYELYRLCVVPNIEELISFAKQRSSYGHELMYSVTIVAKNGWVHLLPGDDLYPESRNYNNDDTIYIKDKTVEQLRENCSVLHRLEQNDTGIVVRFQNHRPLHHINMGNRIVKFRS